MSRSNPLPFCPSCGKEISAESSFCTFCGKPTGFVSNSTGAGSNFNTFSSTSPSDGVGGVPGDLLHSSEIVMKKKILSLREHYDFEDRSGRKLGEGDGNFFQFPARFVVFALTETGQTSEVMHIQGKLISLRHEFTFLDPQGSQLGTIRRKIVKLI